RRRGTRIDLCTDRRASPGRGRDSAGGVRTHGDVSPTASDQRVPPRGLLHVRLHVLGHHSRVDGALTMSPKGDPLSLVLSLQTSPRSKARSPKVNRVVLSSSSGAFSSVACRTWCTTEPRQ